MNQIKLTINGKEFTANPDETILNLARRNNIFIPAICFLIVTIFRKVINKQRPYEKLPIQSLIKKEKNNGTKIWITT